MASLLQRLEELDVVDLRSLLSATFPAGAYEGDRTIRYSSQRGHALSLVYLSERKNGRDPRGEVKQLQRGSALSDEDVQLLIEQLAVLEGPSSDRLASFFHFSALPVTGWWRYRDQFQLLPPPPDAPLPGIVGNPSPFLIEARYTSPDLLHYRSTRRMHTTNQLRLLLPVVVRGPLFESHADRKLKHWVHPIPIRPIAEPPRRGRFNFLKLSHIRQQTRRAQSADPAPVYVQEGYSVAGAHRDGPGLREVDPALAVQVVDDHNAYYSASGIDADDVLTVPAVLTQLFDNYFALGEGVAKRFRRACYWFNLGRFFHDYSFSTSFFADVVAIESMLSGGEEPHVCTECGLKHHPGNTKAFGEFLTTYVPDKPARDAFYDMRSKIAHGSTLLQADIRDEFGGFYPGGLDQYEQRALLRRVSRVALVNWLLAQGNALPSS